MQNRILKFRGWDYGLKQMSYSNLHSIDFDGVLHYGNAEFGRYPMIVMQFTGLLDKNGKEIYEGDIVESHIFAPRLIYKVTFEKEGYWFPFIIEARNEMRENPVFVEVIGNIYENPELLK